MPQGSEAATASGKGEVRCLTYSVEQAGEILGLSRPAAYEAVKRGEIPSLRIGRRLLVPRAALHRLLGPGSEAQGSTSA